MLGQSTSTFATIFVREAMQIGIIDLYYCPTKEMIADMFTKPLSRGKFESLRLAMGMEAL